MKKIFILILAFQSVILYGQRPNRNVLNSNVQNGNQMKLPKFDAAKRAGVFYYEKNEIIRKIKIKNPELKFKVKKAISSYNNKIKEILFSNSVEFSNINVIMNSMRGKSKPDSDNDFRFRVGKFLSSISDSVHKNEKELNSNFKKFLSEKQLKKWLKFQQKKKKKISPKKPQSRVSTSRNMKRRRN